jgi:hypothetical protein
MIITLLYEAETLWVSGGMVPHILNIDIMWRSVVSYVSQCYIAWGEALCGRVHVFTAVSSNTAEGKPLFIPGLEPASSRP